MANIQPFKGVRYNPNRFSDMSIVVSQPYDRIGSELEAQYLGLCPYNITGIILGHDEFEEMPGLSPSGNGYGRARANFEEWLDEEILIRDNQPAIYAYEQTFTVANQTYTRLGMITALELTEFDEGTVLPHERTHSDAKADRLRLLTTLQVNPEQIFMLYPDEENQVNALLRNIIGDRPADIDAVEMFENQVRQRVWVITDKATIEEIQAIMAEKRGLIIADGHHRYETALTYRRHQHELNEDLPANAACNFLPVTLVSMDDPGLVVLPTHREIRNFDKVTPEEILQRATEFFTVQPAADLDSTMAQVNNTADTTFGFYAGPKIGFHTLTLKDDAPLADLITDERSAAWKSLSVSILHRVLLERIAEVPAQGIDEKTMVRYHRDPQGPVTSINAGKGNFVFYLSPTTMDQIKTVTQHGEKMPQKSTDFYPKVISGLVMMPMNKWETLGKAPMPAGMLNSETVPAR